MGPFLSAKQAVETESKYEWLTCGSNNNVSTVSVTDLYNLALLQMTWHLI